MISTKVPIRTWFEMGFKGSIYHDVAQVACTNNLLTPKVFWAKLNKVPIF